MDKLGSIKNIPISASLVNRRGTRPTTIRGPLHLQCGENHDDRELRHLVKEVIAWPHVEGGPLPIGSANLVSLRFSMSKTGRKSYEPNLTGVGIELRSTSQEPAGVAG